MIVVVVMIKIASLLGISYLMIVSPMAIAANTPSIEWACFKHVKTGKAAFMFGATKNNSIKECGIIVPFFIMQLLSLLFVSIMVIASIVCMIINIALDDKVFWYICGCCLFSAMLKDAIIIGIASIMSRIRKKRLNNMKLKKYLGIDTDKNNSK